MQYVPANSLLKKKQIPTEGIHPNLVEERLKCDFPQEQLAEVAWGSKQNLFLFRKIRDTLAKDPILQNQISWQDLERDE